MAERRVLTGLAPPGEHKLFIHRMQRLHHSSTIHRESAQSERIYFCVPLSGPIRVGARRGFPHRDLPHGEATQWSYTYTLPLCLHGCLCPKYAQREQFGCEPAGDFSVCFHCYFNAGCCCVQHAPVKYPKRPGDNADVSMNLWMCCWKWSLPTEGAMMQGAMMI